MLNGKHLEMMGVTKLLVGEIPWDKVLEEINILVQETSYRENSLK